MPKTKIHLRNKLKNHQKCNKIEEKINLLKGCQIRINLLNVITLMINPDQDLLRKKLNQNNDLINLRKKRSSKKISEKLILSLTSLKIRQLLSEFRQKQSCQYQQLDLLKQ